MHDALFGGEDARELRTAATLRSSFSLTVLTSGCWLASPSGHSALYFAIDAAARAIIASFIAASSSISFFIERAERSTTEPSSAGLRP